jgi:hypothetical protein
MQTICGLSIDSIKKAGYSDADVEHILDAAEKYRRRWERDVSEHSALEGVNTEVVDIACNSFQTSLLVGIAKARNITKATKKFGFV